MARSNSSNKWLQEHEADKWVKMAREAGYRSRATFKLMEIQEKDRLFRPGQVVVDLGAAPGGWSQLVAPLVGPNGLVVASDIIDMEPLHQVQFLQGDFTEEACFEELLRILHGREVDIVISDMAPNISGMTDIDQPRAMYLIELAVEFGRKTLRKDGKLLMKVFQGEGYQELLKNLRRDFTQVVVRKPQASRARSREVYVLAKGFKN
jgi:23S rRNA (uridine2552-2'-O)-methyltransferase